MYPNLEEPMCVNQKHIYVHINLSLEYYKNTADFPWPNNREETSKLGLISYTGSLFESNHRRKPVVTGSSKPIQVFR